MIVKPHLEFSLWWYIVAGSPYRHNVDIKGDDISRNLWKLDATTLGIITKYLLVPPI